MSMIKTDGFHHVAYRCRDAKETVEFYQQHLNMDFQLAIAEDHVPSTGAYDPYMHIFLDAGNDNVLAFFELPEQPDMGRDENTPEWVQHIALRVGSLDELLAAKKRLEAADIEVLGPTHHILLRSQRPSPRARGEYPYGCANEAAQRGCARYVKGMERD